MNYKTIYLPLSMENALERRLLCSVSCEANSLSFSGNMSGWTFFIKLLEELNFKASFSILAHILDLILTKDRACMYLIIIALTIMVYFLGCGFG